MRKVVAMLVVLGLSLTGCNYNMIDLEYRFDRAIIKLPNGEVVEGKVTSWTDYDGERLQVEIDGVLYLTSSYNCVLIRE